MRPKLNDLDPHSVKKLIDGQDAELIDVREREEFDQEYIPRAKLYPTSLFEPHKMVAVKDKKVIFYCKSGGRSAWAAMQWAGHYQLPECYHLQGGIIEWKKAGLPTLSPF